jgi:hypothetical protein
MRTFLIALALLAPCFAAAQDEEPYTDADTLYAPEEASPTAETAAAPAGSYYSEAVLRCFEAGDPSREIQGAELFLEGQYMGKSPLSLDRFLVAKPLTLFEARHADWGEGSRPGMRLPAEGEARIYLPGEGAARWYTLPGWVLGLGLIAGSAAVYAQRSESSTSAGTGMVIGGVALIGITQAVARLFHLPSLEKEARRLNASPEPRP